MKVFWYYVKQMFMPIIYAVFASMIALGILCIEDASLKWLKIALLSLNLCLYGFIIVTCFFKEGQTEYKVLIANDIEREQIVRTGENRPLKLIEEYKPWKGFVIGLNSTSPLIIMLLIHAIIQLSGGTSTAVGGLASSLYMFVFGYMCLDIGTSTAAFPFETHYFSLVLVPVMILLIGLSYKLGGRKIELQQEMIREKHHQIYGDKF